MNTAIIRLCSFRLLGGREGDQMTKFDEPPEAPRYSLVGTVSINQEVLASSITCGPRGHTFLYRGTMPALLSCASGPKFS